MITLLSLLLFPSIINADSDLLNSDESKSYERMPISPTRRILKGNAVTNSRPYMVYMRASPNSEDKFQASKWLCGGVIIDKRFILTSAACVEDVKHFQIISGTHTWVPPNDLSNECVNNGAKRAVWKCVPNSYFYDGDDFDNIRWMVGDIAIIKVEDDFNFEKKIRGCDFIPKKIKFNSESKELEKGGTLASIAGWGSTDKFSDPLLEGSIMRNATQPVELQEASVVVISKKSCKKRWGGRYGSIINDEMICTKDSHGEICKDPGTLCKSFGIQDLEDDYYVDNANDTDNKTANLTVHTARHVNYNTRRFIETGGFCENDHGGPLIVGHGMSATVIGIMSACQTKDVTNKCYGPFLYTSVFKYKKLISCAMGAYNDPSCTNILRSPNYSGTSYSHRNFGSGNKSNTRSGVTRTEHAEKPEINTKLGDFTIPILRTPLADEKFEPEWRAAYRNELNINQTETTTLASFKKTRKDISQAKDYPEKPVVIKRFFPDLDVY